jgi:hypothetical protein
MLINTSFDLRTDASGRDPDAYSATLCRYHKFLWSKALPSGVVFNLEVSRRNGTYALHHRSAVGEFFLTSDSITHTYLTWSSLKHITELFSREEKEAFYTLGYTVGGFLVFPGNIIHCKPTINGARGLHPNIKDRFDLTLECIRRHYIGQHSPLEDALERYGDFLALFQDFKGYVEFFMLQDLVVDDYSTVKFFMPFDDFRASPVPRDVDRYREYRRLTIEFLEARNRRIEGYAACYQGTMAVGQIQPPLRASVSTQTTANEVEEAAVVTSAVTPSRDGARTGMTEAQALAEAQAMYGADAMVWVMTHDLKGQPYKTLRYRVGYKAKTETGRFIENGRRMKGVGGSWVEAVYSAKNFATPRPLSEVPKSTPPLQEELKQREYRRLSI